MVGALLSRQKPDKLVCVFQSAQPGNEDLSA